ncbi:hypothetical protein LZ757_04570 [Xylella fastidiosa subsp. morus]|uniref:hypothetical protein n=1 Tax=Xylella fastidiosa TaxID=2371 RepID=UPI0003ED00D3|nr:hypothetical protein [Xylella fastidiosa]AIC12616.1 hypothetical protein P303_06350 [Xylella fastidiosa MUL0034]EWG15322.1 hypothetical protein P910_001621 [Xylella fastidiosa Mul-MD]UIN28762.1 hypothetical protein IUD23_04555 [Xylella fastidiosa subsp. morus]UIT37503.1 hypothetical protein LZ757_04570 [Xylella fastidiosa subsp. morus]UIT39797.1 hypothetical protein LZ755_04570 [Xylella fastidiosa subsp. morus]
MPMSLRFVIATLFSLVLVGCASTSKVMLSPARTPIDPALVRIYSNAPANAIEIAQLESISGSGFGSQAQTDAAIAQLKREAAKLGANGVVLVGVGSQRSGGGVSIGAGSFAGSIASGLSVGIPTMRKQAAGIAIFVPSDSGSSREPQKSPAR